MTARLGTAVPPWALRASRERSWLRRLRTQRIRDYSVVVLYKCTL